MQRYYERVESSPNRVGSSERWSAAVAGAVLVAVPASAWVFRGWLSWMEVVVAMVGIASMAVAVLGFVRRRPRSLQAARPSRRHTVCPRSGEPLTEGA
jgi:hypothetical protein